MDNNNSSNKSWLQYTAKLEFKKHNLFRKTNRTISAGFYLAESRYHLSTLEAAIIFLLTLIEYYLPTYSTYFDCCKESH